MKLTPHTPEIVVDQPERLFGVVKGSFSHRRKSLWNNMLQTYGKDAEAKEKITAALTAADIAPSVRAERLDLTQFTQLYLALRAVGLTQ